MVEIFLTQNICDLWYLHVITPVIPQFHISLLIHNPTVDTPRQHQSDQSSHHTQSPTGHCSRSPDDQTNLLSSSNFLKTSGHHLMKEQENSKAVAGIYTGFFFLSKGGIIAYGNALKLGGSGDMLSQENFWKFMTSETGSSGHIHKKIAFCMCVLDRSLASYPV